MPRPPHRWLKETVRFYGQVEGERLVSNSPDAVLRDTKGGSPGTRSNALTGLPSSGPLGEPAFENVFPFMRIVLIFCIAGLLFFVHCARRALGVPAAYRPSHTNLIKRSVTGNSAHREVTTAMGEAAMSNPEKSNWKARVFEEFEKFFAIAAYLFVLLGVLQLHKGIILMSYGISYSFAQGMIFALVNALVLGKFMLIAEALHAGERWHFKTILYSTLFRSAVFALILVLCHVLEELLVAAWHGRSVWGTPEMNMVEIFASGLIAFVVLIPFCAFRELQRVMGKAELRSLLLHTAHR